jgi:hypothetical protein
MTNRVKYKRNVLQPAIKNKRKAQKDLMKNFRRSDLNLTI